MDKPNHLTLLHTLRGVQINIIINKLNQIINYITQDVSTYSLQDIIKKVQHLDISEKRKGFQLIRCQSLCTSSTIILVLVKRENIINKS